jgi:IMP dehydrogenase/GMP reductase
VTEAKMAIELALAGGMGIIHANQSIESQVVMWHRVCEEIGCMACLVNVM